jgi:hypothetical protein
MLLTVIRNQTAVREKEPRHTLYSNVRSSLEPDVDRRMNLAFSVLAATVTERGAATKGQPARESPARSHLSQ